ncbi:Mu-like prophage major head subunit gpT [Tistlia consotensis]|uniref:Mu-like prophage major head subunit gpT n=1 Tax=Tistlia consotensis USBA 355 TaxID=560819 RepID=A0A1Y6CWT5_9PROT|nr:Mu-like prophage major head subunit gpT family protein [Tistlia consotensis]SMF83023.1 Mu-like prophage major head subunit gpT [Tistlia consotensis USBA 355]SNS31820.1 Mu-like prophage major head subunit gpT [Tistlia consotensis]
MLINSATLTRLGIGFKASFQAGLGMAGAQSERIATTVPSSTKSEEYGWLGKVPNVREWIGDRVVQNLMAHSYTIRNKPWELTIGVDRDDIEDDNIGIYNPLFQQMGQSTGAHRETLIFGLLKSGFTTDCYDGQYMFDTDHPVLDEDGSVTSVANTDGGSGTPWFLIDANKPLKPILFQNRKDWNFVAKDSPTDEKVFSRKEFQYGTDSRSNVGFGFWQFAWGSKQTLDATHYATARAALQGMKGDYGRPLGVMPNLLVVPPALESAGRKLLNSENASGGETNEWKGTAELLVVPWLA